MKSDLRPVAAPSRPLAATPVRPVAATPVRPVAAPSRPLAATPVHPVAAPSRRCCYSFVFYAIIFPPFSRRQLNKQGKRIVRLNYLTFLYKQIQNETKQNKTITLHCHIPYSTHLPTHVQCVTKVLPLCVMMCRFILWSYYRPGEESASCLKEQTEPD